MKQIITFIFVLLAGAGSVFSQTLQDSLILHLKMNGNGVDAGSNGLNASLNGPVPGTDRFGNPAGALFFDGVDDYLTVPYAPVLQPSGPVTISAWVNLSSPKVQSVFWNCWENGNYHGYHMTFTVQNYLNAGFGDGSGQGPSNRNSKTANAGALSVGSWYQVTVVIRAAGDMDLCINGQDITGSYSGSGGSLSYVQMDARSGQSSFNMPTTFFHGYMDDLRFWGRALSKQEVQDLYDGDQVGRIEPGEMAAAANLFSIWPNPVSGEMLFLAGSEDFQELRISLMDLQGRELVVKHNGLYRAGQVLQFPVSKLSPGIYFIRLRTDNGTVCKKLMIP